MWVKALGTSLLPCFFRSKLGAFRGIKFIGLIGDSGFFGRLDLTTTHMMSDYNNNILFRCFIGEIAEEL